MSVHEIPSWAVVEALRAAQARRERSIAARVRAWRERLREARAAARDAASALMPFSGTEAGDRLQRQFRANDSWGGACEKLATHSRARAREERLDE